MALTSEGPANTAGAVDNGPHSTERPGRPLTTITRTSGRSFQRWLDPRWLHAARAVPIERVIEQRGIPLKRQGRELTGPCPICAGTDRFGVNPGKNLFNCRKCGYGGDTISLVMFLDNCDCITAVGTLTGQNFSSFDGPKNNGAGAHQELGLRIPNTEQRPDSDDYQRQQLDKARWLWRRSQPLTNTAAEIYLRHERKCLGAIPNTLRFLPANGKYPPAMVGAFGLADEPEPGSLRIVESAITGIHITRLIADDQQSDAVGPKKSFLGSSSGSPLMLAPVNDLLGLAITEGIEDGLTVHQATGLGVWAAGSAGRMPALATVVPDYVEAVTVFGHTDNNGAGQKGARDLAEALIERGFEVRVEGVTS